MTEDEMAGWHHWLDGPEFEWTPGVGDGQGGLVCCNSWRRKESIMNEWLFWSDLIWFNIVLEVLAIAIGQEKEIKGIQIGKEAVKFSLLQMTWYCKKKTLKIVSENYQNLSVNLAKLQDTKSIHRNHLHFYIITMKNQKQKLTIIPIHHCHKNN